MVDRVWGHVLGSSQGDAGVNGKRNPGAAWYYGEPSAAAQKVRGLIGFWKGVSVQTI